jgi:assimilatory nitrate reductase catalytic subunit
LVTRERPELPDCSYWTRIRTAHGWLTELAGEGDPAALATLLPGGERAEMQDARRGIVRAAVITDGHLQGALFIARDGGLPPREWLMDQLGGEGATTVELLAGRPAAPQADRGPIICVCFGIGMTTILNTIRADTLTSVEAVGAALNAGTNCGSCRPAIARMLQTEMQDEYV